MGIVVTKISLWDTLRLQWHVGVSTFLSGLLAPNPWFVPALIRLNAMLHTVRFLDQMRRKYRSEHLWSWFPFRRTLLVLNLETIDEVLRSDANAADPFLKRRPFSGFAPDALIVSRGDGWTDRRHFNEAALDFGTLHRHHTRFDATIVQEVNVLAPGPASVLRWIDFEAFALRVSHQIVLGSGQIDPELAATLARLVRRSNWALLPRDPDRFAAYYERIALHLDRHRRTRHAKRDETSPSMPARHSDSQCAESRMSESPYAECLMGDSARLLDGGCATASTQVPMQIGFWFFVLKDAIELHVARTLALIATHPNIQTRIRSALSQPPGSASASTIDAYLDSCLSEQLRLWTPVPLLLRRADRSFLLREQIPIRAEHQILIHAAFHHRDTQVFGDKTDRFAPDEITSTTAPLYIFSEHRQSCAGQSLARSLIRSTLAALLAKSRFSLIAPKIEPGRIPHQIDHFHIELHAMDDHE